MSKQEFIDRLRAALTGRVSPGLVQENVDYYEEYINTQIRMGRREREVLEMLGDPRLIAKTIIETSGRTQSNNYEGTDYHNRGYRNGEYQNTGYQGETNRDIKQYRSIRIPGWLWLVIAMLIIVLIFSAISAVLSFLFPIILPVVVVVFFVKLFRDWLN